MQERQRAIAYNINIFEICLFIVKQHDTFPKMFVF